MAELCLNSFWGKLRECENKRKVVLISQLIILCELLKNKTVQLQVFCVMNYKCVEVAFDKINKDAERGQTVNISIAAFTTCWERLRLYHHLDTVNLNALYSDTDSVVYKWWLGQPEIPLGNFLGEVTDELVSGGRMRDHIVNSSPVVLKTMGTGSRGERWVEQCTDSPSTYGGVRCSTLKA